MDHTSQFQRGDLLACFGGDAKSRFVSAWTSCPLAPPGLRFAPSHVALVFEHQHDLVGHALFESTTLCKRPCLIRGERVAGVQVQPIRDRIQEYLDSGGRVDVYRVVPFFRDRIDSQELDRLLLDFVAEPIGYDLREAILSGTRFIKHIRRWCLPNTTLFCSELLVRVLEEFRLMPLTNPAKWTPADLLRHLVAELGVYRFERRYDAAHPLPFALGVFHPSEEGPPGRAPESLLAAA
jgi:hypothetical protein